MAEETRLYKKFSQEVSKLGKIKRAWFTSFNLDISFFERYILPVLAGRTHEDMRSPLSYESISQDMINNVQGDEEDKLEVRVFYDYRALVTSGRPKQTSVILHPVDPSLIKVRGKNRNFFSEGVFHPKICLLQNEKDEVLLLVSSANLTFGGWSKNREGFFCAKVDTKNARRLFAFFQRIIKSTTFSGSKQLLDKLERGKFNAPPSNWLFHSSLNEEKFLDHFYAQNETLRVWSPYFANDLPKLLYELKTRYMDIEIVPSRNENGKIRITESDYSACLEMEDVFFKQDSLNYNECFSHAKIWLTPHALAIGSWNMTYAGMNLSTTGNNIEAGIIYSLTLKEYREVLADHPLSKLKDIDHFSEAELLEEKEDVLGEFNLLVEITADWEDYTYKLTSPSFAELNEKFLGKVFIQLPGHTTIPISKLKASIGFKACYKALLTDRLFAIEDSRGNLLYKGYLNEVGLTFRPVVSFENLDDFLKGWNSDNPEDLKELHKLAYKIEDEYGDELTRDTRKIMYNEDQNLWFSAMTAFQSIRKRISSSQNQKKLDRVKELKRIGRALPGSLMELYNHLNDLLKLYYTDKVSFKKSPIYLWFINEHANAVFKLFNSQVDELELSAEEKIPFIKNIELLELMPKDGSVSEENLLQWESIMLRKIKKVTNENYA